MNLNYYETLIAVADDCPVKQSTAPVPRAGAATIAVLQYKMLLGHPHEHTQEDVLFQTWLEKNQPRAFPDDAERLRMRTDFFAKPQACLRASPLPKKYGWGFLFDQQGKVALCPMESELYRDILIGKGGEITVLKAMRSQRAR
jgi:hypothetical protein